MHSISAATRRNWSPTRIGIDSQAAEVSSRAAAAKPAAGLCSGMRVRTRPAFGHASTVCGVRFPARRARRQQPGGERLVRSEHLISTERHAWSPAGEAKGASRWVAAGGYEGGLAARGASLMLVTKAELHELVDALPEASLDAAGVLLRRAQDPVLAKLDAAPYDDEPLTEDDRAALEQARRERGIPWSEVSSELSSG